MIEKISQEQINDMGIYEALIEIAFNAHSKAKDAYNKDDLALEAKYKEVERKILDAAHFAFHGQTF